MFAARSVRACLPRTASALTFVCLFLPATSIAQVTGTISGYVQDQGAGMVPGATVTAELVGQQLVRSTQSNETGFFDLQALPRGTYVVKVEIVSPTAQDRFEKRIPQHLPTHWFPTYLPLFGRVTFTVWLYFIWCEVERAMTHVDHLNESVRLRGHFHAVWHMRKLRKHGVLVVGDEGALVLRDPPPPSDFQRLLLRYLAIPHLRRSLAHIGWLVLGVLALAGGLYALHLHGLNLFFS